MKCRIFTLLFAFLAIAGNAVWGQSQPYPVGGNTDDKLEINGSGTIEMNSQYRKSNDQIVVKGGLGAITLTLKNVDIDVREGGDTEVNAGSEPEVVDSNAGRCAMEINSGTIVTLIWEGTNKLWSSSQRAGINVKEGATLILKGPDTDGNSLEAGSLCNSDNGKTYGAGIGGDSTDPDFGTIIIESGNITAISQARINRSITICGAGIGGGYADNTSEQYSTDGTIIIKGGNIKAINEHDQNSTENGAGIGGGYKGTCTSIVITGGTVNAESAHGDDIGNGKDFVADNNTPTKPMLIVAPAEKGENLSVTETVVDTNNQLKGNGTSTTLTGTVTVPEGMQVYAPNITEEGTTHVLNAYNVKLNNTQLESEESGSGAHTANNFPDAISDTYYGKSTTDNPTTVTVPVNVTCS